MASKKPGQATWDEFHAIRKRQRSTVERLPTERDLARQKAGAAAGTANKNKNKNKKPAGTSPDTGSTASLARTGSVQQRSATGRMAFIVQPQAQFALLCVIVLDCVAAVVRLLARHGPVPALSTIMIAVDGVRDGGWLVGWLVLLALEQARAVCRAWFVRLHLHVEVSLIVAPAPSCALVCTSYACRLGGCVLYAPCWRCCCC